MHAITKQIPNAVTCCNLVCGCAAAYFAFGGQPATAFALIIAGAAADFFDGMAARLLHVSSPIGKELDSLADVVTFGVAPSAMLFHYLSTAAYPVFMSEASAWLPFSAFAVAAFSAYRLAKFNLDTRQATTFLGLPTPANALFWASLIVGVGDRLSQTPTALPAVLVLCAASCWLLVSETPMMAFKFKHWGWRGNEVKYAFAAFCIPMLFTFRLAAFAAIVAAYAIVSAITAKKAED